MREKSKAIKQDIARLVVKILGGSIAAMLICFPTLLLIIGMAMLGISYDWMEWKTYAGVVVLAIGQLVTRMAMSDVKDGKGIIEGIFTFPKK